MSDTVRFWGYNAQHSKDTNSWRLLSGGEKDTQRATFYSMVALLMEPLRWFLWSSAGGRLEGFLEEVESNLDLKAWEALGRGYRPRDGSWDLELIPKSHFHYFSKARTLNSFRVLLPPRKRQWLNKEGEEGRQGICKIRRFLRLQLRCWPVERGGWR